MTDERTNSSRSFLKRAYPTMKKNNPNTPILIREATGTEPRVWARYGEIGSHHGRRRKLTMSRLWQREIGTVVRYVHMTDFDSKIVLRYFRTFGPGDRR